MLLPPLREDGVVRLRFVFFPIRSLPLPATTGKSDRFLSDSVGRLWVHVACPRMRLNVQSLGLATRWRQVPPRKSGVRVVSIHEQTRQETDDDRDHGSD